MCCLLVGDPISVVVHVGGGAVPVPIVGTVIASVVVSCKYGEPTAGVQLGFVWIVLKRERGRGGEIEGE